VRNVRGEMGSLVFEMAAFMLRVKVVAVAWMQDTIREIAWQRDIKLMFELSK